MKKPLTALCIAALTLLPYPSQAHVRFDANWWKALTIEQRLSTVNGLVDGFESGFFFRGALNPNPDGKSVPTFRRAPTDYEKAISSFYEVHPTAPVSPGDLMLCLADAPLVSCESLAK
jgi:hypothetical protein